MKKLYLSFIGALILSAITITTLCHFTPGARDGLTVFALMFGLGSCIYTGLILHQPMAGHRQTGWRKLLRSGKVWLVTIICAFFLLAGITFSTSQVSPFPDDQANQHAIGYSMLIGWMFGFAVTVLGWRQIGYSDHSIFIFYAKQDGWGTQRINDELLRRQRLGWFEPGDIYLPEDEEAEENALPDR